jgi:hypothetical protein
MESDPNAALGLFGSSGAFRMLPFAGRLADRIHVSRWVSFLRALARRRSR